MSTDIAVPDCALAVGAHPDDVEFGCGGTLAKWAGGGCRIHHLVLTDGSKGTWDANGDRATLVRLRRDEQTRAAVALGGGSVEFLDWVDGELESGLEARRQVCAAIRKVQPAVVLGHDPWRRYRLHPDHRHAGWLVVDAVVAARDPLFFPQTGEAHRPSALLLWEADEPDHVEDIGATLDTKIAALLEHRSQYRSTMGVAEGTPGQAEALAAFAQRVTDQAAAHGALAAVRAGEAFRLLDRV